MKLIVFVLLFACNLANAADLKTVLKNINTKLNPKTEGQLGYTVDVRTDLDGGSDYTWVNIHEVIYQCKPKQINILRNNKIFSSNIITCGVKWAMRPGTTGIYQIICDNKPAAACKRLLAEQLTPELIKLIVDSKFDDVQIR